MTKQIFFFLLTTLCMGLFSCGSEDDPSTVSLAENATNQTKWVTNNESSSFASIEFSTSGNYIVIENVLNKSTSQQKIHFGTYSVTDPTTINLVNMGIVKVKELTNNTVNMEITLNGTSTPLMFTGTKSDNMETTTRTDLLCRTWEVIKHNEKDAAGTEYEGSTILFSKAGTYFVTMPNGGDDAGGLALWKWNEGTNETQFLYTWNGTFEGDYDGSFVTINLLTKTSLIITEKFNEGSQEENEDVWELRPIANVKSTISTSGVSKSRKGLLGNR